MEHIQCSTAGGKVAAEDMNDIRVEICIDIISSPKNYIGPSNKQKSSLQTTTKELAYTGRYVSTHTYMNVALCYQRYIYIYVVLCH